MPYPWQLGREEMDDQILRLAVPPGWTWCVWVKNNLTWCAAAWADREHKVLHLTLFSVYYPENLVQSGLRIIELTLEHGIPFVVNHYKNVMHEIAMPACLVCYDCKPVVMCGLTHPAYCESCNRPPPATTTTTIYLPDE